MSPTSGFEGADGPLEAILAGREGVRSCVRITVGNVVWWEKEVKGVMGGNPRAGKKVWAGTWKSWPLRDTTRL